MKRRKMGFHFSLDRCSQNILGVFLAHKNQSICLLLKRDGNVTARSSVKIVTFNLSFLTHQKNRDLRWKCKNLKVAKNKSLIQIIKKKDKYKMNL